MPGFWRRDFVRSLTREFRRNKYCHGTVLLDLLSEIGWGENLKSLGGPWSRSNDFLNWEESVEVVWTPYKVTSWLATPGWRTQSRCRSHWRDCIWQLALEDLGICQEELESVAGESEVWTDLVSLLALQLSPGKEKGKKNTHTQQEATLL